MKERLVDVLRPITAKGLNVWWQEIRLQYILDTPIRAQLLLDRKHKFQRNLSKPLGYFQLDQTQDLINLSVDVIAAACALALQSKLDMYTSFDVKNAVDSFWVMVKEDVCGLVDLSLRSLREKKLALAITGGKI